MRQKRLVEIQLLDGSLKQVGIEFWYDHLHDLWHLVVSGLNLPVEKFTERDVFEALILLRLELEKIGARVLCAGSRIEVFPSGMSRSMGGGLKGYVTRLGCQASIDDLVEIFDYAEPESIGTVEEQRLFHERWLASLRSQAK